MYFSVKSSSATTGIDILEQTNFDTESIVTPVLADKFEQLLKDAEHPRQEIEFLTNGFKNGFPIGYRGNMHVKMTAPNLKFREVGDEVTLWNKVMKEVGLKRYAGPFDAIPFKDHYIQSPIGLVPKDGGNDTRLIFHLSYPRGGSKKSVNANTPKYLCKVSYPDFKEAIQLCISAGPNCYSAKSDMQSAFRNLGIRKLDFWLLIMKCKNPKNGKWYYFFDKCLPFGASISCSHFQRVSNGVAAIVQYRTGKKLVNYLDDYFFVAMLKLLCNAQVREFLQICATINFPVSMKKTFWASTVIVFLGLLIDNVNQCVSLPIEKIEK